MVLARNATAKIEKVSENHSDRDNSAVSKCSRVRARRRSSRSLSCLRVSFLRPLAALNLSSSSAPSIVAWTRASSPDPAGVSTDAGVASPGVAAADATPEAGFDSNALSLTADLPFIVRRPASTFQISEQSAPTNSWLCEIQRKAPVHSRMPTASPPSASRSRKLVGSSKTRT